MRRNLFTTATIIGGGTVIQQRHQRRNPAIGCDMRALCSSPHRPGDRLERRKDAKWKREFHRARRRCAQCNRYDSLSQSPPSKPRPDAVRTRCPRTPSPPRQHPTSRPLPSAGHGRPPVARMSEPARSPRRRRWSAPLLLDEHASAAGRGSRHGR